MLSSSLKTGIKMEMSLRSVSAGFPRISFVVLSVCIGIDRGLMSAEKC
jgi:hypothetical protein